MADDEILTPGETVQISGIYQSTTSKQRTTLDQGEKTPPAQKPGGKWKLAVRTNPPKKKG